jgi:hypothetical protein
MNDREKLELFTNDELIRKAKEEMDERLKNGLKDGEFRVYFQKNISTIWIERNGKEWYEIDLRRCKNSSELLYLILHIHGKTWANSGGVIAAVLTIIDDACYSTFGESTETLFRRKAALDWENPR